MPDLDLNKLMEMAQNAQDQLQKATQSLESIEVEGVSGGGLVKIRATAKGTILAIDIDESLLQPGEKAMVEDLLAAAINDARAKADQAANAEMQKVTSGLPLPPGMKLPF
jgi:nucleoid-associated protein EbfC